MVAIPPRFLDNCDHGIRLYISNFLLKMVKELNGVWVCYGSIRHTTEVGCMCDADEFGAVLFPVDVECLLFQPRNGRLVVGSVTLVRPSHVGLLVYGVFPATISSKGLTMKGYRFDKETSEFIPSDAVDGETVVPPIRLKCLVALRITNHRCSHTGIISIQGTLDDTSATGVIASASR